MFLIPSRTCFRARDRFFDILIHVFTGITVSMLIGCEMVGPKGRRAGILITGIFFSSGYMLLVLFAYLLRSDYALIQFAISIPTTIVAVYYWYVVFHSNKL